ncbi:hypothetical protein BGW38_009012 [Lunasporangiospora selenospora]|uniref:Uncharacterized protein n=1 Tax=Lunasporangiospora selenospora TaxID=979761 RepID=A0A9P6FZL2_9FUNG|nr:hypothetical protein BGW38_009012 [Lunasporangiospora selenospora]
MLDILKAYRLTGVTLFKEEDIYDEEIIRKYKVTHRPDRKKHVGIRFETFAQAKYREPYYVMFAKTTVPVEDDRDNVEDSTKDILQITKHTIPHWIPLRDLEKRFLNRDISTFTRKISEYLQAFVTKREMINGVIQDLTAAIPAKTRPEQQLPQLEGPSSKDQLETDPSSALPHVVCENMDASIQSATLLFYRYDDLFKLFNRSRRKKNLTYTRSKSNLSKDADTDMDLDHDVSDEAENDFLEDDETVIAALQNRHSESPLLAASVKLQFDDFSSTQPTGVEVRFMVGSDVVDVETIPGHLPLKAIHANWVQYLRSEYNLLRAIEKISDLYDSKMGSRQ